jgi:hypothetical protein
MKRGVVTMARAAAAVLAAPAPAPAESFTDNGSAQVTILALGCGEHILFSGTEHFVFHTTETPTEAREIESFRFVDANLTGVGETSGTIYRLVSVLGQSRVTVPADGDERTQISTTEQKLLIQGGDQTVVLKAVQHITHPPGGTLTAEVNQLRAECTS